MKNIKVKITNLLYHKFSNQKNHLLTMLLISIGISFGACSTNDSVKNDETILKAIELEENTQSPLIYEDLAFIMQDVYSNEGINGIKKWVDTAITEGRRISSDNNKKIKKIYDKCILSLNKSGTKDTIMPYRLPINLKTSTLHSTYTLKNDTCKTCDLLVILRTYK